MEESKYKLSQAIHSKYGLSLDSELVSSEDFLNKKIVLCNQPNPLNSSKKQNLPDICWFSLVQREGFLLFSALYYCLFNIFGFRALGWTREPI